MASIRQHGIALCALTVVACALPNDTEKTKKLLTQYGSIEAEWQIRDDAKKTTYTYVLLRNQKNSFETHEIVATDSKRSVTREQAGGIDGTGCYLYEYGPTTPWIMQKPPEILENARKSGDKLRTACLEYKDTAAWVYVPEKDRKAAEPPPPEPEPPAAGPDAGGLEGTGAESAPPAPTTTPPPTSGDVESAIP